MLGADCLPCGAGHVCLSVLPPCCSAVLQLHRRRPPLLLLLHHPTLFCKTTGCGQQCWLTTRSVMMACSTRGSATVPLFQHPTWPTCGCCSTLCTPHWLLQHSLHTTLPYCSPAGLAPSCARVCPLGCGQPSVCRPPAQHCLSVVWWYGWCLHWHAVVSYGVVWFVGRW